MHVLFVGSHRADKQFSIVGFELALQRHLSDRCEFETALPGVTRILSSSSKWARYVEKYVLFPHELRAKAKAADVVHFCEQGIALNLRHVKDRATLVTVHDFLAIEAAKSRSREWRVGWAGRRFQRMIVDAVSQATGIACVSGATEKSIPAHLPAFTGIVRTIPNGMYKAYHRVDQQEAAKRLGRDLCLSPEGFFLHVGGNKPYKNRVGVLRIYGQMLRSNPDLPYDLVMAGSGRVSELAAAERSQGVVGRVKWVEDPADDQIEALYSTATALIFPSKAEGFGLPIIEAQACGCPVFTTDRAPMNEVGGDAAVYFDCDDTAGAASVVTKNLARAEEMRRQGIENAKRFDPVLMADRYLDFYKDLVDAKPRAAN